MYSIKNNISQIVPAGVYSNTTTTTADDFTCYADNFDLSLLSNDGEVPLSPQSQLTVQTHYQNQFNTSHTNLFASDYIPATIFNDAPSPQSSYNSDGYNNQQMLTPVSSPQYQPMKTEKTDWLKYSMHEISQQLLSKQINQENNNDFLSQLSINYNYQYPSPLPSPPQQKENKFIPNYYPPSPPNSICSSSAGSSPSQNTTTHDYCNFTTIKQEFGVSSLPPSPPDSNGAPSPVCCDIKIEPDHQDEVCIDIESLLNDSFKTPDDHHQHSKEFAHHPAQDHQLLREYLQDTSFQRKHNLKPVALESLFGGWSTRGDIEPVFSLALEQIKRDVQDTCALLDIPPDPLMWTSNQVQSWLKSQISTWNLKEISNIENTFPENGAELSQLSEDEFVRRVPESGATLYAQLVVWKGACSEVGGTSTITSLSAATLNSSPMMSPLPNVPLIQSDEWSNITAPLNTTNTSSKNNMTDLSDDEDEEMPLDLNSPSSVAAPVASPTAATSTVGASTSPTTQTGTPRTGRQGGSHIHLWQFLKELLASPQTHGTAIRWLDRTKGVFKIEDSVRVARLWGRRKNRPAMNYDKLSRSIRQYYKKGIMKKTERSQRLVYQFCHPYCL